MHLEPALAYLIADGARARVVLRHGDGHLSPLGAFSNKAAQRARKDTRGRVYASVGGARSAVEEPDPAVGRRRFAAQLADAVEDYVADGAFERLVLIAPARMLADIRSVLSPVARDAVAGELAKDLTKLPDSKLRPVLDELVVGAAH